MGGWVAQLIDQATADMLGKCWGLGSGTRKHPGRWPAGGSVLAAAKGAKSGP